MLWVIGVARLLTAYPARALGPQCVASPLGVLLVRTRTMFKIPAYDPFSIILMGAGILLAAHLIG